MLMPRLKVMAYTGFCPKMVKTQGPAEAIFTVALGWSPLDLQAKLNLPLKRGHVALGPAVAKHVRKSITFKRIRTLGHSQNVAT